MSDEIESARKKIADSVAAGVLFVLAGGASTLSAIGTSEQEAMNLMLEAVDEALKETRREIA